MKEYEGNTMYGHAPHYNFTGFSTPCHNDIRIKKYSELYSPYSRNSFNRKKNNLSNVLMGYNRFPNTTRNSELEYSESTFTMDEWTINPAQMAPLVGINIEPVQLPTSGEAFDESVISPTSYLDQFNLIMPGLDAVEQQFIAKNSNNLDTPSPFSSFNTPNIQDYVYDNNAVNNYNKVLFPSIEQHYRTPNSSVNCMQSNDIIHNDINNGINNDYTNNHTPYATPDIIFTPKDPPIYDSSFNYLYDVKVQEEYFLLKKSEQVLLSELDNMKFHYINHRYIDSETRADDLTYDVYSTIDKKLIDTDTNSYSDSNIPVITNDKYEFKYLFQKKDDSQNDLDKIRDVSGIELEDEPFLLNEQYNQEEKIMKEDGIDKKEDKNKKVIENKLDNLLFDFSPLNVADISKSPSNIPCKTGISNNIPKSALSDKSESIHKATRIVNEQLEDIQRIKAQVIQELQTKIKDGTILKASLNQLQKKIESVDPTEYWGRLSDNSNLSDEESESIDYDYLNNDSVKQDRLIDSYGVDKNHFCRGVLGFECENGWANSDKNVLALRTWMHWKAKAAHIKNLRS